MVFFVHMFRARFLEIWERLASEDPSKFPEEHMGTVFTEIFAFFRVPPDPTLPFPANCHINTARPPACRVYPLSRQLILKKGQQSAHSETPGLSIIDRQRVLLRTDLCPPEAFEKGKLRSASQFLETQGVNDHYFVVLHRLDQFLPQLLHNPDRYG